MVTVSLACVGAAGSSKRTGSSDLVRLVGLVVGVRHGDQVRAGLHGVLADDGDVGDQVERLGDVDLGVGDGDRPGTHEQAGLVVEGMDVAAAVVVRPLRGVCAVAVGVRRA